MSLSITAGATALCLVAAVPAVEAATASGTLAFTATGFPAGAPYDTVSGAVAYSFDNSAGFANLADGATANGAPVHVQLLSLSLPGAWTPVLTYFTVFNGQPADFFSIGNAPTTAVGGSTDDFRVAFNGTSGAPTFRELTYSVATLAPIFQTFSGTAAAVPEPQTGLLLAAGLAAGAAGAARRRRPGGDADHSTS